jgi:tetratricopeptide (TPR) repeat protein
MRIIKLLGTFLSLASLSALGQSTATQTPMQPQAASQPGPAKPAAAASTLPTDYSAEPIVLEKLDSVYEMAADGTGYKQQTVVAKVQSESSVKGLGVVNIPFAGNSQRVEIAYVRVRRLDGSVTQTPTSEAIEMPSPVTTAAPFYSDLKQMQIPVRNLHVGDTLEWQAKVVQTKAEAPEQFWGQESFSSEAVTLSETLELRVPKDIYVNVWSPKNKPVETVVGTERIFHWESAQKKPTAGKEADAEKELKKKKIWTADEETDAKEGKLPDVAWTTFKSWEAVGAWYRGLESDRIMADTELKAKVAELVAAKTSEEEKVRAVYSYAGMQIRYIGVAFGIGRYQPHKASEVLENQYGDCKDKHTLLAAMLTSLGLHPDAVLIGVGIRFNEAVPSPAAFNHLITTVQVNGQQVWLDSTAEVAPYRMLSYAIRDKRALVIPETDAATIERTPAKPPFDPFDTMEATGTLGKDGISNSRLTLTLHGDDELQLRAAFRQISPAQYGQLVQQLSQGMGYAGTTSNVEVSRLEDTGEPLKISYDYKRERAGDWDNYRIIPQLVPVELPRIDDKEPPVQAIALGVPHVENSTSAMKLPDGWGAELPEAVHAKSVYATYDETYRFDKGTVYTQRRIEVLQEKVPVADWKSYKKWADTVDLGNEIYIQLTGMGGKSSPGKAPEKVESKPAEKPAGNAAGKEPEKEPEREPGSAGTSNTEAEKLIAAAYQAVQRHDLDTATAKLDEAKALNPEQAWLWTACGYMELQRYQLPTAAEDFQKELKYHPETYAAYAPLAQTQKTLDRRKEAKETLEKWAEAQKDSPRPASMLAAMLLEDEDPAGAVAVAEAAVARLPDDAKKDQELQLLLGRAQMKAGMKDKGDATLLALMQSTEDPGVMNDSAYELAVAGRELPLAEASTKAALAKLTDETAAWTLDENPQTLRAKSNLLAATWDTMGWILYREGKVDEGERYVKAGWLNSQTAEGGEHLGEIAAAKGNKDAALHAYELALATIPAYDLMGVPKPPSPVQKEMTQRADALRKAGAKSSAHGDSHEGLQKVRTFPLGPAAGLNGTAEYRLLLSAGKVEKVEGAGAKDLPGGSEIIMHAKLDGLWPAGSQAKLVRNGFLNCHAGICELVLEP